jgi:hypothetical protein
MKYLRNFWALPAVLRLSLAFSVQDDLLAFPQVRPAIALTAFELFLCSAGPPGILSSDGRTLVGWKMRMLTHFPAAASMKSVS